MRALWLRIRFMDPRLRREVIEWAIAWIVMLSLYGAWVWKNLHTEPARYSSPHGVFE